MRKVIDTNVLIRYLVGDLQSTKIEKLLKADYKNIIITDITLAEIIWVLLSFYKLKKSEIVKAVRGIINLKIEIANLELNTTALNLYEKYEIDYADAYNAAFSITRNLDGVISYDKDFKKVKEVNLYQP